MKKLVVIDYGTSNLRSVAKALEHVADRRYQVTVSGEAKTILSADKVVFPGQGAIGQCMKHLEEKQLDDVIHQCVRTKPYLGICLGLQSLLEMSEEDGGTSGLGIIPGKVIRFLDGQQDERGEKYKIPHMGWNQVKQTQVHPLWQGIDDQSRFYFVHSYYVKPGDDSYTCGQCEYNKAFTAAIAKDNMFATQFHPEKSQNNGLKLLTNFLDWNV